MEKTSHGKNKKKKREEAYRHCQQAKHNEAREGYLEKSAFSYKKAHEGLETSGVALAKRSFRRAIEGGSE